MVAAAAKASSSGCPLTALKGALSTRPYVKYVALAAAGGVLAYLIYSYAASDTDTAAPPVIEPKADSAQKSPKQGGKSKRKKRRFSSKTKPFGASSGSETTTSSSSGGKGRPLHPADSRRKSSTPRK